MMTKNASIVTSVLIATNKKDILSSRSFCTTELSLYRTRDLFRYRWPNNEIVRSYNAEQLKDVRS